MHFSEFLATHVKPYFQIVIFLFALLFRLSSQKNHAVSFVMRQQRDSVKI
jgi:hypothetical protein